MMYPYELYMEVRVKCFYREDVLLWLEISGWIYAPLWYFFVVKNSRLV